MVRLLFLPLCLVYAFSSGQTDSLVQAEGKILHATTREPITARITYQSLPFGNTVGTLTNATYSFTMFNNEKYILMVEANGFAPVKYTLDPALANTDRHLVKDIELTPTGNEADNSAKHAVGHVMRLNNLIFQLGNSKISPDSYGELNTVVNMMKDNATMVIQLEGHTDYQGNPKDNMKLSQQRVDAVKNYVVSKGISKKRIKTKAFGGTQPLSREDTPDVHRMNRRVELRILEN